MPDDQTSGELIERYFAAMRARAENGMAALFADDAIYIEPFSSGPAGRGEKRTHTGKPVITQFFGNAWKHQPPDMTVTVDRMDVDGSSIRSEWTCSSAAFPAPMRGFDIVEVRNGKITRLETTLLPPEKE